MSQSQAISHWSIGRGRGFRPSQPYKPSRRPNQSGPATGEPPNLASKTKSSGGCTATAADIQSDLQECRLDSATASRTTGETPADSGRSSQSSKRTSSTPSSSSSSSQSKPAIVPQSGVTKLRAKYSYKANAESPLGQKELSLKQGQDLVFVGTCQENDMWWKVKEAQGPGEGFVPASYVEAVAEKVTQLPWLAAKQTAEEAELPKCKPEWKPYKSAYNREGNVSQGNDNPEYYCKWCEKQLNGPVPYRAHMKSKAHKEEVELAKENGTYTEDE